MNPERVNLHATAVIVGGTGLLLRGPSGAGKSRLALSIIDHCRARGKFAVLVADDRVWLTPHGGRLVASAPEAIAGLVEIRAHGPAGIAHEPRAVIDRVVMLVDPADAPRHRAEARETLAGISLPRLDVPARDEDGAARAVLAWLEESQSG